MLDCARGTTIAGPAFRSILSGSLSSVGFATLAATSSVSSCRWKAYLFAKRWKCWPSGPASSYRTGLHRGRVRPQRPATSRRSSAPWLGPSRFITNICSKRPTPNRRGDILTERGITPESIEKFHIGFAPDRWEWILAQAQPGEANSGEANQISSRAKILEAVGLLGRREGGGTYDRFRGRVLFSIRDTQNRPSA